MPSLINYEFFVGEINVAGWENTKAVKERLERLINIYEPRFLDMAMGTAFAELFKEGITNSSAKYVKLRDGGVFKLSTGKSVRFAGIANSTTKTSPIADFVYYWSCRDMDTQTSTAGEVANDADNAKKASAKGKAARAWNSAVYAAQQLWEILQYGVDANGAALYPDFKIDHTDRCELRPINAMGI